MAPHGDLEGAQDALGYGGDQLLHQGHHVPVVGVGLVRLQHGELRGVLAGEPLVAEDAPDLVDLLEPPISRRLRYSSREMRR